MFEIGFWELALLFALGLIVLGPEKLPRVAAQLGRYAGQARRMARTLGNQIRDELEAEESRTHEQRRHHPPAADADEDVDIEVAADAAVTPEPKPGGSEQQELPLESMDKPPSESRAEPQTGPAQTRPVYSRPGVDDLIPKGERSSATPSHEVAADSRDPS